MFLHHLLYLTEDSYLGRFGSWFRYVPYCSFLCHVICRVRPFCRQQRISQVLN